MKRQVFHWQNKATLLTVICAVVLFAFQTTPAHAQLTELYGFQYSPSTTSNYPDGERPMAELIFTVLPCGATASPYASRRPTNLSIKVRSVPTTNRSAILAA